MAKNTIVLAMPEWRVSGNPIYVELWTVFIPTEGEKKGRLIYKYVDLNGEVQESESKGQFKKIPVANGNPYMKNFDSNDHKAKAECDFIMSLPQVSDADGVERKKTGKPTGKILVNGYYTLDRAKSNVETITQRSQVLSHFLGLKLSDKVLVSLKYGQNIEGYSHSRIIELMCDVGYELIMPVKNPEMNWVQEKPQMKPKGILWQGANAIGYISMMKSGLKSFEKEITIQKGIISGVIEFKSATGYSFGGQYLGADHLAVNKSFSDHPELFMLLQNEVANKNFNNEDDLKGKEIAAEEIPAPREIHVPKQEINEIVDFMEGNKDEIGFEEMLPKSKGKKSVAV